MASAIPEWIGTNDYHLSSRNPIATADQIWVEQKSLRLLARTDVQAAIRQAQFLWATVSETVTDQAKGLLGDFIQEYALNYINKACNSDANYPRIFQNWMIEHEWFGHKVPSARIGGDNPDNGYRLIPVEHGGHYRIDGRWLETGPADVTWTIVGNPGTSITLASLDNEDLVVGEDGSFTVTVDDLPANGRPNHLQTKRGALFLFVRDALGDWDNERPNVLRVTRLNPTDAAPIDEDEMAYRAIQWMLGDVPLYYWFTMLTHGKPVNRLIPPTPSGGVGGLRSQFGCYGTLRIADDEAYVIKVNAGNAAFRDIVVHDWWHRSIAPDRFTGSLNNAQIAPDADGHFTFAIGPKDPGIHNWLDTGGLNETILLLRWQGVPRATPDDQLPRLLSEQLVKLDNIEAATEGARTINSEGRAKQISSRRASWAGRLSL
ncbi:DUF1214 domain-containing protein [Novosphingobium taihuense]|uniref:DUF1214 domain-containing protein n=1 Tax=Novosphingobium taihuense TaxID=260085 RepID=A0A7W7AC65_9SPHN|nr:DUF1214 domain-containing protein [Novosphingobium taihuense]MBB4614227.1 hypothetical protein [Novosphingobium taihuense]TWH87074.1 uncharacterized protein DUF1214 [Novosphingobium taihuense]